MVISDEVLGGITYWIISEIFYFVAILPSVLIGGWKSYDWETFIGVSILMPMALLVTYLFGCLLDILIK